jgi:hypothetical protein
VRILIINRWDDDFADYNRYVDHNTHQVTYVTIPTHARRIPTGTEHTEFVGDMTDTERILTAVEQCRKAVGEFDRVLALSEFDLLTAANVREIYSVPGLDTAATLNFRDKPRMKEILGAAGVRVPRFCLVRTPEEVVAFTAELACDVIVKPRTGAASVGCLFLSRGTNFQDALASLDLRDYEAEEFLSGPIWHVDGLMHQGELGCGYGSRYLNTCYDFAHGRFLGSVVRSGPEADEVVAFAGRCLQLLGLQSSAFHLEIIETPSGLAFLEVGARVGGGEIPFIFRDVYGIDLVGDWIRMELGEEPLTMPSGNHAEHAGFLMVPEAVGQRVISRNSMMGTVAELYAEVLPAVGHVFDGSGGYENLLGRFRYRATTAEAVERAIHRTLDLYRYELEPQVPQLVGT